MKDPAVLFYINDWLTSTSEMDADCRGWYLNLLLHNYDKGSLPNEIEKLAVLCMVKFSEYERFKQVFEQVLKQKFEELDEHRISNLRTQNILKSREIFKEKRSDAGKISYLMKYFAKNHNKQYKIIKVREFVKSNFDLEIDTKNQTEIEQMFKHLFELYINENEIVNTNEIENTIENRKLKFAESLKPFNEKYGTQMLNDFYKYWSESNQLNTKFRKELQTTWETSKRLETWARNDKKFNKKEPEKSVKTYI